MATVHRTAILVIVLILLGEGAPPRAQEPWQPLFDGKSLTGWRAAENASSWRVENGALVASGPRSHLFYVGDGRQAPFKNFELEVEVMTRPGANSGVYFHSAYQDSGWPSKGFEVQVNNTYAGDEQYQERKKTGSLYGIRNVYGQIVSDNEWFRLNVTVRANQVRVRVNDVLTVDYVEPSEPMPRRLSEGTFAFQAHDPNSTVSFRNIRVRRLAGDIQAAPAPVADDTYRELIRLGGDNFPVVDYHTHIKGTLTPDDVLRRWREQGIYAGLAVNGGLGFPVNNDAGLDPFLRDTKGRPVSSPSRPRAASG